MSKLKKPIDECPHCGEDAGYYLRVIYSGQGTAWYEYDGSPGNNTHMHDGVSYRELKTAFCAQCHEKVGMVKN